MADCTALAVVLRSLVTAEIDTFMSEVSTTSTNIAMESSTISRRLPEPATSTFRSASGGPTYVRFDVLRSIVYPNGVGISRICGARSRPSTGGRFWRPGSATARCSRGS